MDVIETLIGDFRNSLVYFKTFKVRSHINFYRRISITKKERKKRKKKSQK